MFALLTSCDFCVLPPPPPPLSSKHQHLNENKSGFTVTALRLLQRGAAGGCLQQLREADDYPQSAERRRLDSVRVDLRLRGEQMERPWAGQKDPIGAQAP